MDWHNVKSSTPKPYVSVLCYMPGEKSFQNVREGFITNYGKWVVGFFGELHLKVTHWAEMPKYKGGNKNG